MDLGWLPQITIRCTIVGCVDCSRYIPQGISFLGKQPNNMKELQEFLGESGPLRGFIESIGWVGPVVYGLVYALCTVFMIPGTILSLASGIIFPQVSNCWTSFANSVSCG